MDKVLVKPNLNQKIWMVFGTGFFEETVIAKGDEIFFHTGCPDPLNTEPYRVPLRYEDYGTTWFKNLKEIRAKHSIVKITEGYYESR